MYRKNLGDQIKDIVEDAVSSCNYQDLNDKIRNTAQRAIDEFNHATGSFVSQDRDRSWNDSHPEFGQGSGQRENSEYRYGGKNGKRDSNGRPYNERNGQQNFSQNRYHQQRNRYQQTYQSRNNVGMPRKNKVRIKGKISSMVCTVLSSIGAVAFGITAIVIGCVWAAMGFGDSVFQILVSCFSIATLGCIVGIAAGTRKRRFIGRFEIYQSLLGKNKFCELKRMSEVVNKSNAFVLRDLKKMMMLSMFPEGHFDDQKTYFIENDETYTQYMAAQKSYQERIKENNLKKPEEKEQEKAAQNGEADQELAKAIAIGKEYIRQIRKANDDIPGEEISRKLDQLETIISKIFVCVEQHPEKLSEIRKFMEYYLPITSKLVNAYKEFDSQPIQGENINNSKKEIEATLDTIDLAFEKLLDSLYEDEAMEVSSDISVLNALFAQEGLTKKDFDLK